MMTLLELYGQFFLLTQKKDFTSRMKKSNRNQKLLKNLRQASNLRRLQSLKDQDRKF
jgi:hypothetical protein